MAGPEVQSFTVQIFLSHATVDGDVVAKVKSAVGSLATIYCTEDDGQAGTNVHAKIKRELDNSDVVIALLTKTAANSPYVHQELGYAQRAKKLIIPVISADVTNDQLAMLEGIEYIRIDEGSSADWLDRLTKRIEAVVRRYQLEMAAAGILLVVLGVMILAEN